MYCVRCGVKLQDGAKSCPLCATPVMLPDALPEQRSYPETLPQQHCESRRAAAITLTVLCALPALVLLAVCFRLYGELSWGGYALCGLGLFYVTVALPLWFRDPPAAVFVPVDWAAAAAVALYVCGRTGGNWFLSFALPVAGICCLLSTALTCLLLYVRRGRLFIFGGFFILTGGATMLVEFFEHITFGAQMFRWSLYSLAGFAAAGLFLLIAGMIRPLRLTLEKRFFF